MAELKFPRLLFAAKEFNVDQEVIIGFLLGIGFSKEQLKPTSKLTEEMYRALQKEYGQDKTTKFKVDVVKKEMQTTEIPSLEIYIDPGTAPKEEIASILADLSHLFRKIGGGGIEFKLDHVTLKQGEVI
jgi:uncharacterized protein YneF (UPF0154 family)